MSEPVPDYHPCEIELEFADGSHVFKLTLKTIAELQEKCGAGIGAIYARIANGTYRAEDLVEVCRLGLIGGGMEGPDARKLLDRYCVDRWPLEKWHGHAYAIMVACVHGYQAPDQPDDAEKKTA